MNSRPSPCPWQRAGIPKQGDNKVIDPFIVQTVDEILDRNVAQIYKDQPLAQDWARVSKGIEEKGEAIAELILATGQNPRKGIDSLAYERLMAELADTAMTYIYAIQHFTKMISETEYYIQQAQHKHLSRLTEDDAKRE
jgi:hypothetical protein